MPSTTFDAMIGEYDPPLSERIQEHVAWYVGQGWVVTPLRPVLAGGACTCYRGRECKARGKHPLEKGWNRRPPRTLSPDEAASYWDRDNHDGPLPGIGVVCWLSSLIVVDVDDMARWEAWEGRKTLPETRTEISPRDGGGLHLYFHFTVPSDDYRVMTTIPGTVIEVKHNGLVVASPTMHKTGRQYRWQDTSVPVAEAPGWLSAPRPSSPALESIPELSEEAAELLRMEGEPDNVWARRLLAVDLAGVERLALMRPKSGGRPTRAHAVAYYLAAWTLSGALSEERVFGMVMEASERNGSLRDYSEDDMARQVRNGIRQGRATSLARHAVRQGGGCA